MLQVFCEEEADINVSSAVGGWRTVVGYSDGRQIVLIDCRGLNAVPHCLQKIASPNDLTDCVA